MQNNTLETSYKLVELWKQCPVTRHYSFSDKRLWSKQEEILRAVRQYKRVAVKSANTCGKSFIAADVILDFLITNKNSVVVTTAPTFQQVETILWREIRSSVLASKIPFGAQLLQTELRFNDKWYAIGVSVDNPINFQGKHAESGRLLVVIDEASGFPVDLWDMVEALHPSNILVIGNPTDVTGRFYEAFQSALWHKITISAEECIAWQNKNGEIPGLVKLDWVNDMVEIHGKNSDWYRIHVLGEFPLQQEGALINRDWVKRARKGLDLDGLPVDAPDDSSPKIISLDLATKHGNDMTVMLYRHGHLFLSCDAYYQNTFYQTRDYAQAKYSKEAADYCVSDATGVGESMAELLSHVKVPCYEFRGGSGDQAMDKIRFKNLRTQFYWLVAKKFEKGLYDLTRLDDKSYEILEQQLCSIKAKKPDAMGRVQIETKEDMQTKGIKSPDYADAFAMSEYGYWMRNMAELRPRSYGGI